MPFSGEFVELDDVTLQVRRIRRDAETLVFIHGLTDSAACWERVAMQFASEYDIAAVDLRGHGLSGLPSNDDRNAKSCSKGYSAAEHARDVVGILESLELGAVTLVGHSLGAETATSVARLRPDFVRRLVLEDPPWSDDWLTSDPEIRLAKRREWADSLEPLQQMSFDDLLALGRNQMPHWVDEELVPWARSKLQLRTQALDYILADRAAWQLVVRGLHCPTLLLIGETARGGLVSDAAAEEARCLKSDLEVLRLAGAGHCVHRDQFDGYIAGVRRFLAET